MYKKQNIPNALKISVWNRYIGHDIAISKCCCCEIRDINMRSFHCGHINAESNNGKTNINNLIPICQTCNTSMSKNDLFVFKERITGVPYIIEYDLIVKWKKFFKHLNWNYKKFSTYFYIVNFNNLHVEISNIQHITKDNLTLFNKYYNKINYSNNNEFMILQKPLSFDYNNMISNNTNINILGTGYSIKSDKHQILGNVIIKYQNNEHYFDLV
jgi:hypothetical protein